MRGIVLAAEVWGIDADVFAGWGQWAGAAGSFAAVWVALRIAIRDGRHRDAERRDQEKAQARTVTSRIGMVQTGVMGFGRGSSMSVVVENHSSSPIMNVAVESISAYVDGKHCTQWVLGWFGDLHDDQTLYTLATVIGPDDSAVGFGLSFADADDEDKFPDTKRAKVSFTFTDAHGLVWRRIGNGEPVRVIYDEIPAGGGLLGRIRRRRWYRARRTQVAERHER